MAPPKADRGEAEKSARERCYAEIVADMKGSFARYLQEFPERLGDARNKDAVDWSTRGLERILKILDRYSIEDAPAPEGKRAAR